MKQGGTHFKHRSTLLVFIYLALLVIFPAAACVLPEKTPDITGYFSGTASIWPDAQMPTTPQVALFRQRFTNRIDLEGAQLHIFADTRYDVWLDGQWIGRGPARFARTYREVDIYPLDKIPPGKHLLAVRVQWAPNLRRSESIRPLLKTYIETPNGTKIAASGKGWKGIISEAWRSNASPVHAWNLIGPTELLDLHLLPDDWYLPQFDDSQWLPAVIVSESSPDGSLAADQIVYMPRSIPFLENRPVKAALIEIGLLSPGFQFGELLSGLPVPAALSFSTSETWAFTLETLSNTLTAEAVHLIQVDGKLPEWQPAGPDRPDVVATRLDLPVGKHEILFGSLPIDGLTFSMGMAEGDLAGAFQQGVHAGRRLLLANPVPQWKASASTDNAPALGRQGQSIAFEKLPAYAILDLGRTTYGRLEAQVSGPDGTILDIGWDERLTATGRPLPYPGSLHPEWNQVDSWVLDGTSRTITTIDARAGRYIMIAAWGDGPVKIENIQVYEESYPAPQNGGFQASLKNSAMSASTATNPAGTGTGTPLLDRVWQMGVDTLHATMADSYMDTPWRERGQWWGDVYVEERINQAAYGDTHLVRRGILLMAATMQTDPAPGMATNNNGLHMLDYSMLWVHSLAEYTLRSGDLSLARQVYPTLRQFMQHLEDLENQQSRLIDLPKAEWSQTAYLDTAGGANRFGQSTAINSLYYATLLQAAGIAGQLDEADSAEAQQEWLKKAQIVKTNLNDLLYLPAEGRYLTTIHAGETYAPTPHAQAWPLAYGLVPPEQTQAVVTSLLELLSPDPAAPNLQIFGMYWVLEGLGQSGHIADGIALIEKYYGHLLDAGATTWWENFNANQYQWSSLSHGWGGSPTWFLTSYVLGARQTGPHDWSIQPAILEMEQASGALPLSPDPAQALKVAWEYPLCHQANLQVTAPAGSQGILWLPYISPEMQITLDGQLIWQNDQQIAPKTGSGAQTESLPGPPAEKRIRIPLGEGTHQLSVQGVESPGGCQADTP